MKRYQKILLGMVVTVILLSAAAKLYVAYYLDDRIERELVTRFNEATEKRYDLAIGDTDLHIIGSELRFGDIKLIQKKSDGGESLRVQLDEFNLSGIGFLQLLFSKELTIQLVELNQPVISLAVSGRSDGSGKSPELQNLSARIAEKVLKNLNSLSVPRLSVRDLSLEANRGNFSGETFLSLDGDIELYGFAVDSASLKERRTVPLKNMTLDFRNVHFIPDTLYRISAGSVDYSASDETLNISAVRMNPRLERGDFSDYVGHETDRITMLLDEIRCSGIDAERLNRAEGLFVESIILDRPSLNIYRDKRPPFPANNRPPLPQQMIRNIPFPIAVDSIRLVGGHIRYNERQPEAEEPGYIDFADLMASMVRLSNIEERWSKKKVPLLRAGADIMNRGRLEAVFRFPMTAPEDIQVIEGSLQPMDLQPLNIAFEPLAFARIDGGRILGLDFRMRLGEKRSTGELTLLYEDLKISLLDKKANEENVGSQIKSLLANVFVIKSDNGGDSPRSGKIDFERVERKSVFNYWWKSLLSGLKTNIGV